MDRRAQVPKSTRTLCARERVLATGPAGLSDAELVAAVLGGQRGNPTPEDAAVSLLQRLPLSELAWSSPSALAAQPHLGPGRAAALAAAFELGRRAAWSPPRRGQHCLSPTAVHELMRHIAHSPVEEFHVVLLDVRGRLISTQMVARGSISVCPVSPGDALRPAVEAAAHGVIFVHSHPSGDPTPSPDDVDLTERLRTGSEIIGVRARDHVIVASQGYYSFVEAGRWTR